MKRFCIAALLATTFGIQCADAQQALNDNLLFNGSAESGAGSPQCATVPTPGWNTTGNFTVGTYGGRSDVLSPNSPGPASFGKNGRGLNFFCGGNGANSSASQTLFLEKAFSDPSSAANVIDSGNLKFNLSGWLGGFESSNDGATLLATFKDRNGTQISQTSIGPVTANDRSNVTSLLFRSTTGQIPPGTRSVDVTLKMERTDGQLDDAYADNISFSIDNTQKTSSSSGSQSTVFAGSTGNVTTSTTVGTGSSGHGPTSSGGTNSSTSGGTSTSSGANNSSGGGLLGSLNTTPSGGTTQSGSSLQTSGSVATTVVNSPTGGFASGLGTFLGSFTAALNKANGTPSSFQQQKVSPISAVVHDRGKTTITLNSDLIFDKSKWSLTPVGDKVLEQVRLAEVVSRQNRPIIIEGHTDEMIDAGDNLALSTMRALTVASWMVKRGVPANNQQVRGYGKTMPKLMNVNGINRAENRRVEIILTDQ